MNHNYIIMFDCSICKMKYSYTYNNLCVFCDIVYNLKKSDTYKYIICFSKLDQTEIIKKTYDYFMSNNKIPLPKQIDDCAIILAVNPYIFQKHIKNKDYKLFFTNIINKNNIKTKRFDNSTYYKENLNYSDYVGKNLLDIDINIYNEYNSLINI